MSLSYFPNSWSDGGITSWQNSKPLFSVEVTLVLSGPVPTNALARSSLAQHVF